MKKKSFLLCAVTAFLGIGATSTLMFANNLENKFKPSTAEMVTYTMTADSTQFASLGTSFTRTSGFELGSDTSGTWKVQVNVVNGKKDENNKLVLGKLGKVLNFGSSTANAFSSIKGIKSILVIFTGDLSLQFSSRKDGLELTSKQALTSNAIVENWDYGKNYFCLSTVDGATIEKIVINYSCSDNNYDSTDYLDGTVWTAKTDDLIYQLDINGYNFDVKSLNGATEEVYNGSYNKTDGKICATFPVTYGGGYTAVVTMKFNETEDHRYLLIADKSDSIGGAIADSLASLNFERVYTVEDFEGYAETGVGYTANNAESNRSGLQGHYIADFGGGSGSPVGTSGFGLMGSTDFLTLETGDAHTGSQAGKFKASQGKWMRYWQYDQLVGEPYEAGRGDYISMWVKNPSSSAVSMKWGSMKTNAALNDSTRNLGDFVSAIVPANSDWTEYTVPLTGTSYGWYVGFNNSNATAYLYIDDVKIYSETPYAEYEEPLNPNLRTFASIGSFPTTAAAQAANINEIDYFVSLGKNGEGKIFFNGKQVTIDDYDVDDDGNVTIDTTFTYEIPNVMITLTLTKITGTFNAAGTAIENVTLTGDGLGSVLASTTGLTLAIDSTANGFEAASMTTSVAQAYFKRWYHSGSAWVEDTTNADRIEVVEDNGIEGTKALKVRGHNKFRVTLAQDLEERKHFGGMGLWMKNVGTKAYTFRWFYYVGTGLVDGKNPGVETIPADGKWHYYQCGANYDAYNYALYFEASGATNTDCILIDYVQIY